MSERTAILEPRRAATLLAAFGSLEGVRRGVKRAGVEQIAALAGRGTRSARRG